MNKLLLEQGGGLLLEQGGHLLLEQQSATIRVRDFAKPEIVVSNEQQISLSVDLSNTTLTDEGLTYNQAGVTYNQVGDHYGGVSNIDSSQIPIIDSIIDY